MSAASALILAWNIDSGLYGSRLRFMPCKGAAAFLESNSVPAGTIIANVNWSDFPALFYAAPQYRYLCGMDPMFGYRFDRERMSILEDFHRGKVMIPKERLAEVTGASLAFVSIFDWELASAMFRHGYPILYQGEDGWLFALRDSR